MRSVNWGATLAVAAVATATGATATACAVDAGHGDGADRTGTGADGGPPEHGEEPADEDEPLRYGSGKTVDILPTERPRWEIIGDTEHCRFARAMNLAALLPAFEWESCGEGCERTVVETDRWFALGTSARRPASPSRISEVEGSISLAMTIHSRSRENVFVVTDGEGNVRAALRVIGLDEGRDCDFTHSSTWGDTVAVNVNASSVCPVRTKLLESTVAVIELGSPETIRLLPAGKPGDYAAVTFGLGTQRWVGGRWSLGALELASGSNQTVAPERADRDIASSTGDFFLFAETQTVGYSSVETDRVLRITDGVQPPRTWLDLPDAAPGAVRYGNSHVGFVRATERDEEHDWMFHHLEVWSAEWTPDPGAVQPRKLGIHHSGDGRHMPESTTAAAGWGYYVLGAPYFEGELPGYTVWNLATGRSQHYDASGELAYHRALGITRSHTYVTLREDPGNSPYAFERRPTGF